MVTQVPYYEDSSGRAHKTALAAWKADLQLWLMQSEAVNEPGAKGLVEHICKDRKRMKEFREILGSLEANLPDETTAKETRNDIAG